tara:strand:- start:33 stop:452 length:420 start_codon:yes stop_codon:yes gene_type:complete
MIIRPIILNDFAEYTKLVNSSISLNDYSSYLDTTLGRYHQMYVLEVVGKVVGVGTLLCEKKMTYGGCVMGHIENIVVGEDSRGKGYGKAIVEKLVSVAKSEGCYRIDLNCNTELEHFYNANGFDRKHLCMNIYIKDNFK